MTTTAPPSAGAAAQGAPPTTGGASDRARSEQRLGWLLAGPAFAVMLLVTAYPIAQAIYDSLFSYRLTDPGNREFVGLGNYWVVLTDALWWQAFAVTVLITVVTVVEPG